MKISKSFPDGHDIRFSTKDQTDILVLRNNGDIMVKGRLAGSDEEIIEAMRTFLRAVVPMGDSTEQYLKKFSE